MKLNNKLRKQFLKERTTPRGLIKCNCGRNVKESNIVYVYPLDINYFDYWHYEIDPNSKDCLDFKINYNIRDHPILSRLNMIPGIKPIFVFLHNIFHKPAIIFITECKYCTNEYGEEDVE